MSLLESAVAGLSFILVGHFLTKERDKKYDGKICLTPDSPTCGCASPYEAEGRQSIVVAKRTWPTDQNGTTVP